MMAHQGPPLRTPCHNIENMFLMGSQFFPACAAINLKRGSEGGPPEVAQDFASQQYLEAPTPTISRGPPRATRAKRFPVLLISHEAPLLDVRLIACIGALLFGIRCRGPPPGAGAQDQRSLIGRGPARNTRSPRKSNSWTARGAKKHEQPPKT